METYQLICAVGAGASTGFALITYSSKAYSLTVIFGAVALILFFSGMPTHI